MNHNPLYKSPAAEQAVMNLYDAALARWPVVYDAHYLPTRHGDTFVVTSGAVDAPPLLLLHGAGSNSAIWLGDVPAYAQHYRVHAIDLLGEAGKSAPNRPPWDSAAYAEWLEDVLDGLRVQQAVLIGISQGGWTILKFAVAQPQRVAQLVLMCPGGVTADRSSFVWRALALSLLGKWGTRRLVRLLYGQQSVPAGVEDIFTVVMSGFKARIGVLPLFSDAELARLTMPTLLLGGSQDALRDVNAIAARLQGLLPRLTVRILPGAGHVMLNTVAPTLAFLAQTTSTERSA